MTPGDAANEQIRLYINGGTLAGGLQNSAATHAAWQDGNDNAGLGSVGGTATGGNNGGGVFDGDIALVRIYDGPMTDAEVQTLWTNVTIPEPGSASLVLLGALGAVLRRRR